MITLRQNTLNMKVLKRIYKYIAIISLFFSISQLSANAHIPSPKHEVRAVWLTTIGGLDWPHSYARSENSVKVIIIFLYLKLNTYFCMKILK